MMKSLYLALFVAIVFAATLGGPLFVSAQDTAWFDFNGKSVNSQYAYFYETTVQTDSGWKFADHWLNGKLKITGTIAADSKTRIGTFAYYDSTGVMQKRFRYTGSNENGVETNYYPGGQLMLEGNVEDGDKEGDWTAYYPSGKLKAKATFKDGQQASASFYNEDGSLNNTMNVFFQETDYPGGPRAWLRFLNKNLRYPDEAVKQNLQGTVIIRFKVSKDGRTSEFTVLRSAYTSLDNEALRVIKASGDWQPAIYGGTPTDTYKSQPIIFKTESFR
jgi:TonB family protein